MVEIEAAETGERGVRTHKLDPNKYRCSRFVRDLAEEIHLQQQQAHLSYGGLQTYVTAARMLGDWHDEHAPNPEQARLKSLSPEVLDAWETDLLQSYSATSNQPYEYSSRVIRLIRDRAEQGRDVAPRMVKRVNGGGALAERKFGRPVDDYANSDLQALLRAARSAHTDLVERIDAGMTTAQEAGDPDEHGWNSLANLLHAITAGRIVTTADLRSNLSPHRRDLEPALRNLARVQNHKPVPVAPERLEGFSRLFSLYHEAAPTRVGDRQLAEELNADGYRSARGRPWTQHSIRQVLSRRYQGIPLSLEKTTHLQTYREESRRDWRANDLK